MDPLSALKKARIKGIIPDKVCDLILSRFHYTVGGIDRIESASQLNFPIAYVEPSALITPGGHHGYGILFARTIPMLFNGDIRIIIQISAPLVAYGLKGTVHAVLAHEFLHYLDLIRRLHRKHMVSDEITSDLFESAHADSGRALEPGAVFTDRTLIRHIKKRFIGGFIDRRLERKVVQQWVEKGLLQTSISLDRNTINLSASSMSSVRLPETMARRLDVMYEKSQRIRSRRRLY